MHEVLTPRQRDSLADIATEVWQAMTTLQAYADHGRVVREELLRSRVHLFDAITRLNEMGVPIPRMPTQAEMNR